MSGGWCWTPKQEGKKSLEKTFVFDGMRLSPVVTHFLFGKQNVEKPDFWNEVNL